MLATQTACSFLSVLGCIVSVLAQSPTMATPKAVPTSLYVTTVQDLRATFGVEADVMLDLPESAEDAAAARFAAEEWAELRVRAAKEIATFAQAARLPTADFGLAKEPKELGYDDIRYHLLQLAQLTAAQGWHHVRLREPGAAAQDAVTLLRHARHLAMVPSVFAGYGSFAAERYGAALLCEACRAEAGLNATALERLRTELDEHLQRRGGRLQLLANVQEEVRRLLATTVRAAAAKRSAATEQVAERNLADELVASRGQAIADRIERIVAGWLAPLQREQDFDLAAALAELNRQVAAAKRTTEPSKLRVQLQKLPAEQAVEAVATMYALMLCPPIKEPLEHEALAAVELLACRRRLGGAPTVK